MVCFTYPRPLLVIGSLQKAGDQATLRRFAQIGIQRARQHLEEYPDNPRAWYLGAAAFLVLNDPDEGRKWAETALAAISGLAVLITASPDLFRAFEWAGAAYLAWLGIRGLLAKPAPPDRAGPAASGRSAARDGFLIAFLNPKIAVFFIALFAQVIGPDTPWAARLLYAGTAWFIDTAWYLLVAWLFSVPRWLERLQRNAVWFERLFCAILLAVAARLVWETLV